MTVGTGRFVYSPLDLTTGLLDTRPWGVVGYAPAYAEAVITTVVAAAAGTR